MAIVNTTFRAYIEKLGATEAASFIGNEGDLFYDPNTASLRVSDGSTPGGIPVTGVTTVSGPIQSSLIPDSDGTLDLGSPTNQWRDIYATGNTIYLGGTSLGINTSGHLAVGGSEIPTTDEVANISTDAASNSTLIVNTDRRIYSEGVPGVENPNPSSGGWYHRTGNGDYIRWNFWSPKPNAYSGNTLGDLVNGWCLFTPWSATTEYPYIQLYTLPKLGGGNAASWYRSRVTYSRASEVHTPGTPVLLWFGSQEPTVFQGVPRRQMTLDAFSTQGPQGADEVIFSNYLSTSTGTFDGAYDFSTTGYGVRMGSTDYNYALYAVPFPSSQYQLDVTTSLTVDGNEVAVKSGVTTTFDTGGVTFQITDGIITSIS